MPTKNHNFDRWLRFAPWMAAIMVALCLILLVARTAIRAIAGSDRADHAPIAARSQPGQPSSSRLPRHSPTTDRAIDNNSSHSAGEANDSLKTDQSSARASVAASSAANAAPPKLGQAVKEPSSPSSKGRFEIHGARGASLAGAGDETPGFPTSNHSAPPHPVEDFIGQPATAAASPDAFARVNNRLPDLQGLAQTSFFGIEATGRRFVYVLDRSGSMGEPNNKPLRAAKEELLKSLERLDSVHQFVVIFYNQQPSVFAGDVPGRVPFATELNKKSAENFVAAIAPQGGTDHYQAIAKAIKLHPDVIFLLTDGEKKDDLTADELADLKRMNAAAARIYVIQFAGSPYPSNSLVRLANENQGQHTYLDIRKPMSVERNGP